MRIMGYYTVLGRRSEVVLSGDPEELLTFLEAHLYDEEVVLADSGDSMIFHAVDGVDLHSKLDEFGIDLPALYRRLREETVSATSHDDDREREPWEVVYDSIGLSPGEIAMRQRVKRAAMAAHTVADVVELLAGTYFEARFETEDRSRRWRRFQPDHLSAEEEMEGGDGIRHVRLSPEARVRHHSSREDVHEFVLLDPPAEYVAGAD